MKKYVCPELTEINCSLESVCAGAKVCPVKAGHKGEAYGWCQNATNCDYPEHRGLPSCPLRTSTTGGGGFDSSNPSKVI